MEDIQSVPAPRMAPVTSSNPNGEKSPSTAEDAAVKSERLRAIRDVVSRYVDQLVNGCGDPACNNGLCDTGRRRTSRGPYRKYTPRSARTIAFAVASGPRPRGHLCSKYSTDEFVQTHESSLPARQVDEGPLDSSSFAQQLSNTPTIRKLFERPEATDHQDKLSPGSRLSPGDRSLVDMATEIHGRLDVVSRMGSNLGEASENAMSSSQEIANRLVQCMGTLAEKICLTTRSSDLYYAFEIVGNGHACSINDRMPPTNRADDTKRPVLDVLNNNVVVELVCRILRLISLQTPGVPKHPYHGSQWVLTLFGTGIVDYCQKQPDPSQMASIIVLCLQTAFLLHWEGSAIVHRGGIPHTALEIQTVIFLAIEPSPDPVTGDLPNTQIPAVSKRLRAVDLARAWMEPRAADAVHLFKLWPTFDTPKVFEVFRTINYLKMREAYWRAQKVCTLRLHKTSGAAYIRYDKKLKHLEEHYLLLNVSRGNVLRDAFDQLWHRRRGEMQRPLRVRLGEIDEFEIGHDLGGVQIEFFNLVCKELFSEDAQMFTTDPSTGFSYFRAGSLQPLYMFELCGMLFSLAIYNGITLPVRFPKVFYLQLVGSRIAGPASIDDAWPAISKSLASILENDVDGLEAVLPLEANGVRLDVSKCVRASDGSARSTMHVFDAARVVHPLASQRTKKEESTTAAPASGVWSEEGDTEPPRSQEHTAEKGPSPVENSYSGEIDLRDIADAWPGWHLVRSDSEPEELTAGNKHECAQAYVDWLATDSVYPQWTSFKRGLEACFERLEGFRLVTAPVLAALVEGSSAGLDIAHLRHVTVYVGYHPLSPYMNCFWAVVASWPAEKQRRLVRFVTAVERLPALGAHHLVFKISRSQPPSAESLPTASTCFGTLFLPLYESAKVLDEKLSLAVELGMEGFGTG